VIPIARLGLNKLFLWSEAERFHTYPQAMARLTPARTYTRRQVAEELMQLGYAKGNRKPLRESQTYNLFGFAQVGQDKLLLKGINLLRRVTPHGRHNVAGMNVWERAGDEWAPTQAALELGEAYRCKPKDLRWQQLLAEQLARYEPRTRTMLHLLSHDHRLRFESPGYFAGNTQRAQLEGETNYALFGEEGVAFNRLLFDHILVEDQGAWSVETDVLARHLTPDLTRDLLGEAYAGPPSPPDEWRRLAHAVKGLADKQGFVVASQLADRWGELADLPPGERTAALDALIRRGIFEGRVEILDRHPGQPRMGRGLLDDDNMRMVRLRVLT
jgi:hypothetical protein